MAVDTQKDDLDAIEAALLEINDDTQCCLCNAMLVVDDGDGRWDRMEHKPDCPFLAYTNLIAELRAARAVIEAAHEPMYDEDGDNTCRLCNWCLTCPPTPDKHAANCPLVAYDKLVAEQGRG